MVADGDKRGQKFGVSWSITLFTASDYPQLPGTDTTATKEPDAFSRCAGFPRLPSVRNTHVGAKWSSETAALPLGG